MTIEKLISELDQAVRLPGVTNAWTMPIKTRIDMLSTGIKTPVGIKVAGPDLGTAARARRADRGDPPERARRHAQRRIAERVVGGNYLDFDIDRQARSLATDSRR